MNFHESFDKLILVLKSFSTLGFCAIFMYWSTTAILKYLGKPISSTVSYKFGDDGHGNIDFPTITICLNSFNWVALSGIYYNCSASARLSTSSFQMLLSRKNEQSK